MRRNFEVKFTWQSVVKGMQRLKKNGWFIFLLQENVNWLSILIKFSLETIFSFNLRCFFKTRNRKYVNHELCAGAVSVSSARRGFLVNLELMSITLSKEDKKNPNLDFQNWEKKFWPKLERNLFIQFFKWFFINLTLEIHSIIYCFLGERTHFWT